VFAVDENWKALQTATLDASAAHVIRRIHLPERICGTVSIGVPNRSLSLLRPLDTVGMGGSSGERVHRLLNRPQLDGSSLTLTGVDDRLRFPAGSYAQGYVHTIRRARAAGILIRQLEKLCSVEQIGQVRKGIDVD